MTHDYEKHTFLVPEISKNTRLDKFLSTYLPSHSRNYIQDQISAGYVYLNDKLCTKPSHKLEENDVVSIQLDNRSEVKDYTLEPYAMSLDIRYEDEHLAIINKPTGISMHPGAGVKSGTLANALVHHFGKNLAETSDPTRPGIVHRLDKDTSGLVIVAKTSKAHHLLAKMIKNRQVSRAYLALVKGALTPPVGTIRTYYGRSKSNPKKMTVKHLSKREAITHYVTKGVLADSTFSLVECKLETGRTHQIRVHLAHKKHPIIGDQMYGSFVNLSHLELETQNLIKNLKHQFLHAYKLAFEHPITHEHLEFEQPLPHMLELILQSINNH